MTSHESRLAIVERRPRVWMFFGLALSVLFTFVYLRTRGAY